MKTLTGTVHQGQVELTDQTELVEGQAVIVLVPENQDAPLPAEAMKLLARLDAFRHEVEPVGCSTRDFVGHAAEMAQCWTLAYLPTLANVLTPHKSFASVNATRIPSKESTHRHNSD